METGLTAQQQLALDQQKLLLERLDQAGTHLDSKALGMMQSAGIILALVTAVSLPLSTPTLAGKVALGAAFLAFVAMIWLSTRAWFPRAYYMPGTRDWQDLFTKYVQADLDQAFVQTLSNYREGIKILETANIQKGVSIRWSAGLFVVQIVGLLIVALAG